MIAHEEHGSGSSVVLVHGVGLDRGMWRRCLPALAERHRVVLADLRGHGASAPAAPGVTLSELAGDVLALDDGPLHLVGFSLGALVATEAALAAPERVRSLTLVSSVAGRSPQQRAAVRERLARARDAFSESVEVAIARWFSDDWATGEPALVEDVRATLLAIERDSYLACYAVFAEGDAELWPRLPALAVPTLAITGSDDAGSTPAMTRALAERIPHARAVVVDGARHLLPLERPDVLTAHILEHLERTDERHRDDHADAPQPLHRG
jgi:pimeloyl-ACP methyl ester carboxylesterase